MARKALKALAASNASRLNRTHLTTLALHTLYHLARLLRPRPAHARAALLRYALLCAPALAIELLVFERGSRPRYAAADDARAAGAAAAAGAGAGAGADAGEAAGGARELRAAGADLDAPGLTDLLWDVVYWTWAVLALVAVAGEWAWWLYVSARVSPSFLVPSLLTLALSRAFDGRCERARRVTRRATSGAGLPR